MRMAVKMDCYDPHIQDHLKKAEDLLGQGANVNCLSDSYYLGILGRISTLHCAINALCPPAVHFLIKHQIKINISTDTLDYGLNSALHTLVHAIKFKRDRLNAVKAITMLLLNAGGDVNIKNHDGKTPLMSLFCPKTYYLSPEGLAVVELFLAKHDPCM